MGLEMLFGFGTLVLLIALVFGVMQHRMRNRRASEIAEQVVRDRYRRNET